jgi:hypothetical protein
MRSHKAAGGAQAIAEIQAIGIGVQRERADLLAVAGWPFGSFETAGLRDVGSETLPESPRR